MRNLKPLYDDINRLPGGSMMEARGFIQSYTVTNPELALERLKKLHDLVVYLMSRYSGKRIGVMTDKQYFRLNHHYWELWIIQQLIHKVEKQ